MIYIPRQRNGHLQRTAYPDPTLPRLQVLVASQQWIVASLNFIDSIKGRGFNVLSFELSGFAEGYASCCKLAGAWVLDTLYRATAKASALKHDERRTG